MVANTCVLAVLVGTIFYLLVFNDNGRVNANLAQSGNGESDASTRDDECSVDDDRNHLLPVDVPMDESV